MLPSPEHVNFEESLSVTRVDDFNDIINILVVLNTYYLYLNIYYPDDTILQKSENVIFLFDVTECL
jgi:hypothetical protein